MTNKTKSPFKLETIQRKLQDSTGQELFNEGLSLTVNILLGSWAGSAIGDLVGQDKKGAKIGCTLGALAYFDTLGRE